MSEFRKISNRLLYRWKFWFWVERKVSVKLHRIDKEMGAIRLHNMKILTDDSKGRDFSFAPRK